MPPPSRIQPTSSALMRRPQYDVDDIDETKETIDFDRAQHDNDDDTTNEEDDDEDDNDDDDEELVDDSDDQSENVAASAVDKNALRAAVAAIAEDTMQSADIQIKVPLAGYNAPPLPAFVAHWQRIRSEYCAPLYYVPFPQFTPMSSIELFTVTLFFGINALTTIITIIQLTSASSLDDAVNTARNIGSYAQMNLIIIFFPVTQNTIWLYILGIPFDRAIKYHRWIARTMITMLTLHGACMWIVYAHYGVYSSNAMDGFFALNGSGFITLVCAWVLASTSLEFIRRRAWEVFIRFHWVFAIAFLIMGTVHNGIIIVAIPGIILYLIDWYYRIQSLRSRVVLTSITALPPAIVRLEMTKSHFYYECGQYVFICIPAIDPLQWHSFSLSSSPHQTQLVVHCKVVGDWTMRLYQLAIAINARANQLPAKMNAINDESEDADEDNVVASQVANATSTPLQAEFPLIYVDGAYGAVSYPLSNYDCIVVIAGGIGVTTVSSIFYSVIQRYLHGEQRLCQLAFVWTVKDAMLLTSILDDSSDQVIAESNTSGYDDDDQDAPDERSSSPTSDSGAMQSPFSDALLAVHGQSLTKMTISDVSRAERLSDIIDTQLFITQNSETSDIESATRQFGQSVCPTRRRPNIQHILRSFKQRCITTKQQTQDISNDNVDDEAAVETSNPTTPVSTSPSWLPQFPRALVCCCGPRELIKSVRVACQQESSDQLIFDCHEEYFTI